MILIPSPSNSIKSSIIRNYSDPIKSQNPVTQALMRMDHNRPVIVDHTRVLSRYGTAAPGVAAIMMPQSFLPRSQYPLSLTAPVKLAPVNPGTLDQMQIDIEHAYKVLAETARNFHPNVLIPVGGILGLSDSPIFMFHHLRSPKSPNTFLAGSTAVSPTGLVSMEHSFVHVNPRSGFINSHMRSRSAPDECFLQPIDSKVEATPFDDPAFHLPPKTREKMVGVMYDARNHMSITMYDGDLADPKVTEGLAVVSYWYTSSQGSRVKHSLLVYLCSHLPGSCDAYRSFFNITKLIKSRRR
ncbi:hypothetical protein P389DRAFT_108733 [Cystobasidium minutum MCA 4210]|uniref:uncharacterized protein n=1 Tax=Cystobasidium minutum MCA 4210 TaxID=1397322 RepID=UPI0034CF5E83|eukprot:jgi/Rhomi1/108733/CE108732_242